MTLEKHSKVASKSDESHFWSHLCWSCIKVEWNVFGAGSAVPLLKSAVIWRMLNLTVLPHKGPAPENTEDHARWHLNWSESSIQHGYWGWEASQSLKEQEKDFCHGYIVCPVSMKIVEVTQCRIKCWSVMLTTRAPTHSSRHMGMEGFSAVQEHLRAEFFSVFLA